MLQPTDKYMYLKMDILRSHGVRSEEHFSVPQQCFFCSTAHVCGVVINQHLCGGQHASTLLECPTKYKSHWPTSGRSVVSVIESPGMQAIPDWKTMYLPKVQTYLLLFQELDLQQHFCLPNVLQIVYLRLQVSSLHISLCLVMFEYSHLCSETVAWISWYQVFERKNTKPAYITVK